MNQFDEVAQNHDGQHRRPSLGKILPVSSLLLDLTSKTSSALKAEEAKDSFVPSNEQIVTNYNQSYCDMNSEIHNLQSLNLLHSSNTKSPQKLVETTMNQTVTSKNEIGSASLSRLEENSNLASSGLMENASTNPNSSSSGTDCSSCPVRDESAFTEPNHKIGSSLIALQRQKFLNEMLEDDEENKDSFDTSNDIYNDDEDINPVNINNKNEIAEALAKTSAMTSSIKMKQRLAARNLEIEFENAKALTMNITNESIVNTSSATGFDTKAVKEALTAYAKNYETNPIQFNSEYQGPPKHILIYLVRMGSFNSAPKINNIDSQDDNFEIPEGFTSKQMLEHVKLLRGEGQPPLLSRFFANPYLKANSIISNDITDGLRCLELNTVSRVCSAPTSTPYHLRLLQWNILSQTLGQNNDGFVCCPEQALTWNYRKYLIIQEILQTDPDIICLQEVDHFKFLQNILGSLNYEGIFYPKPDSPCLYIQENNGPDGCSIFFKRDKFELKKSNSRILEVWRVQSNQVAVAVNLYMKNLDKELCVCTTHLKARRGALLAQLRNEQGRDLMHFVKDFAGERPVLLCGDFNAEPTEPIYSSILQADFLDLSSAYSTMRIESKAKKPSLSEMKESEIKDPIQKSIDNEPPYTTWKIRENGEECHTIDYIFYSKSQLKVKNCLQFPDGESIGLNRTPNFQYPSDHFSLVCDFDMIDN